MVAQPLGAREGQLVVLEEVPRQLAPLLSLQRPLSARRFFSAASLYRCAAGTSARKAVYSSSQ